MQVLVAGVNAATTAVVDKLLSSREHEQIVAQNGAEALDCVRGRSLPLIVVEDPLSDMTGSDFCRRARESPGGANAVILVISHKDDALPAVLDAGATDLYVTSLGPAALEIRLLIAERLVAEHARLRDREARFRRLFESGITGVTIADLNGNFKEANDAFLRMLGYTRAEMLAGAVNWTRIAPIDRVVQDIEAGEQLRATGFLPLREREFVHKDGHHVATLVGAAVLEGTGECISYVTDISERKKSEEALLASEAHYRALFNNSPLPKWVCDVETLRFLAVNDTAVKHYGYSREEFLQMTVEDICPPDCIPPSRRASGAPSGTVPHRIRKHVMKGGASIDVEETVHTLTFLDRPCRLVVARDVTERQRAEAALRSSEERLQQAQKMEAVGRLAGGVAHDFNNLLSVILSYSDMLVGELKPSDPMRGDLEQIKAAGIHAAELTRQLLAFSRKQLLRPIVLDPNAIIADLENLLRRVIGEDIALTVVGATDIGRVNVDPGQLEQILMNLVANSREAMPIGGRLTIETSNIELDAEDASQIDVAPGRYVALTVADTGTGMDRATRDRVFEPFFTTKNRGKGTGLGLATVFGIVRQSGGHIVVQSEPGEGTTFNVYFPRADASATAVPLRSLSDSSMPRGAETILLVEDEDRVRVLARTILQRQGYHVIEASNGGEALLVCEQHKAPIHLLLTDVVMPRMGGWQLSERLQALRPEMKVIYMSGYTDDSIVCHGILDADISFLQKPIIPSVLAQRVRGVLDSPKDGAVPRAQESGAASGTMRLREQTRSVSSEE